jgi:hypothetical protein
MANARVESLEATLLAAMPGEVTALQREDIRRLASLMTLAERARSRALEGKRVDHERWLRTENLVNRLRKSFGLATPPKPRPTLPWQALQRRTAP